MDESSEDSVLDETTEDATRMDETSDEDSVTVKSSKNPKTKPIEKEKGKLIEPLFS